MKTYLLPQNTNSYKANLHCHSVLSDGRMTPEALKEAYMKEGYSILAYTDHDDYIDHSELSDDSFLAITAYEADISDNIVKDAHFRRCYHFCCYDKHPAKGKTALEPLPDYRDIHAVNRYIQQLNENGFLVCYNHPNWSLQTWADYKDLKGLFAMEILNYSSVIDGIDNGQEVAYDTLLREGNKLYCVATDDNHDINPIGHPMNDSFGGFIVVKAKNLNYDTVMEALEKGHFYASGGPEIKALFVEDGKLHIDCSDARKITMTTHGRRAGCIRAAKGEALTYAEFEIDPTDRYIRVQVEDHEGNKANSNAYFLEDFFSEA